MEFSKSSLLLLLPLLLLSLFQEPAFAAKRSYVVYMGSHSHGTDITEANLEQVTNAHHEFLGTFLGSHEDAADATFYSYKRHINGFAAVIDEEVAAKIAEHPNVISVFPDRPKKLHTTRSWDFMRLGHNGVPYIGSLWKAANFGKDIIIANLDTGVWPKSKSFNDVGYGPVPKKWRGSCVAGVSCNKKLIGARYYVKGFQQDKSSYRKAKDLVTSRDEEGHGSHTLSTVGGDFVPGVSVSGLGNGTASGGSPKARVASYKVCWSNGCYDSDLLAAFDAAIYDGVDVLSVSVGGDPDTYFEDSIAIGAWHAVARGITVVCSAGNSGPVPATVTNNAPWIITVGASSVDRDFVTFVDLGNGEHIKGTSLSPALPEHKNYEIIASTTAKAANATKEDAQLCRLGSLDPEKAKGKIIACLRGDNARVEKSETCFRANAAGMVLCNDEASGDELISDLHILPAAHVNYHEGLKIFKYIKSTKNPTAYLIPPASKVGTKPNPVMAAFSSQGPNTVTPGILKPDITAPGVSIIAAFTEALSPDEDSFDKRRVPYATMSGTSMACPHIAGTVGLLTKAHPSWSPAAIRSAIMTSARTIDNTGEAIRNGSMVTATPFNYGAGHVNPNGAMMPGLIYDMNNKDYLDFLCASGYNKTSMAVFSDPPYECSRHAVVSGIKDLNYPSITVPKLHGGPVTVNRRVRNVGLPFSRYVVRVQSPPGVAVSVKPKVLKFHRHWEEKSFTVTMKPVKGVDKVKSEYVFGELAWTNGLHIVRSPIVVGA